MIKDSLVYLIPTFLDEQSVNVLPGYIADAITDCQVFFAEDLRTARRYLKLLHKDIQIDRFEWFAIQKAEEMVQAEFIKKLKAGKTVGILCEAGCPAVADPGQLLVQAAHELGVAVKPLVGPSSILLALMASGMNGQRFQFVGYLPIDAQQRQKIIRELESESEKRGTTQIFIETPYRNNQLLEALLHHAKPSTRLCIASGITGSQEFIHTLTISQWKLRLPDLHKKPTIFLLLA